ncbi:MAG: DUF3800 domain-containing protein [Solirubrobacterales bacterium]|nr:DUF3800 domain-containing protein [Solirubrobacterales bacterium]
MYLLFLDESGVPGDDGIFALGGVAIRADQWAEVKERFHSCLTEAGWPADREYKWSEIVGGHGAAEEASYSVYECLGHLPIHSLVTVLYTEGDDPEFRERYFADAATIYRTALTFIAERFQRFLAHHDSYGVIVLDSRRYEEDDHMRRYFDRIHEEGTDFAELGRIVDGLLLGPSHYSLGLQLADLVVGPTRASRYQGPGAATRSFRSLKPTFMAHPDTGKVEGVGLKVFPGRRSDEEDRLFQPGDLEDAEDVAAFDSAMAEEGPNVPWAEVKADLDGE